MSGSLSSRAVRHSCRRSVGHGGAKRALETIRVYLRNLSDVNKRKISKQNRAFQERIAPFRDCINFIKVCGFADEATDYVFKENDVTIICAEVGLQLIEARLQEEEIFQKIFLTQDVLPLESRKLLQDCRDQSAVPSSPTDSIMPYKIDSFDAEFVQCRGRRHGMMAWGPTDPQASPVGRFQTLADYRFVFPDAALAKQYLDSRFKQLADLDKGFEEETELREVGEQCVTYRNVNAMAGVTIVQYIYLFRVGRVVAKLYGACISEANTFPNVKFEELAVHAATSIQLQMPPK